MFMEGAARWSLDGQSLYFVVPSVLFWLALAFVLHRQNYTTAVGWGLLSPIIVSLFVGGIAGPFVALVMWYVSFPVGILTGVLVKFCVSVGRKSPNQSLT